MLWHRKIVLWKIRHGNEVLYSVPLLTIPYSLTIPTKIGQPIHYTQAHHTMKSKYSFVTTNIKQKGYAWHESIVSKLSAAAHVSLITFKELMASCTITRNAAGTPADQMCFVSNLAVKVLHVIHHVLGPIK